jgi:hypothetical protein
MSQLIIKSFVNTYKNVFVSACRGKQIKHIPFPKHPINQDHLIENYTEDLYYYIHTQKMKNPDKYVFKPITNEFPNEYFRYESN